MNRVTAAVSLAGALLLVPDSSHATQVTLALHLNGTGDPGSMRGVSITATPFSRKGDAIELREATQSGSETTVDLPPGRWMVRARSERFWSAPAYLAVADRPFVSAIEFWAAGSVSGRVFLEKGESVPSELTVRFAPADRSETTPAGEETCLVDTQRSFRCRVAAGTSDLRIRARGYVTHFRIGAIIGSGVSYDAGAIALKRGGTIVGQAVAGRRQKVLLAECVAFATPIGVGTAVGGSPGAPLTTLTAHVDARGLFHIDGAAGGEYEVGVRGQQLFSARKRIRLLPGGEVEIQDSFILEPPLTLALSIAPPADSAGKPWHVSLAEYTSPRHTQDVTQSAAAADGTWTATQLRPGRYLLRIADHNANIWSYRDFDVEDDLTSVALLIDSVAVAGTLRLGTKPLAARLTFGGRSGAVRVALDSDDDGRFSGAVPRFEGAHWKVSVDSRTPAVKRDVTVSVPDSTHAKLDVVLPATVVLGTVRHSDGSPSRRALVTLTAIDDSSIQRAVEEDGTFALTGVPPGRCVAQAAEGADEQSDPVDFKVGDDAPAEVALTLRPVKRFAGRIVSSSGPVPGAKVYPFPTDVKELLSYAATSNTDGQFAHVLAPASRELDVMIAAPGFAFRMFHIPTPEKAIEIAVDPTGGTIIAPNSAKPPREGAKPYLIHRGAVVPVEQLTWIWPGREERQGESPRFVIPMLEPGDYALCFATDAEVDSLHRPTRGCRNGFLAPMAELDFGSK